MSMSTATPFDLGALEGCVTILVVGGSGTQRSVLTRELVMARRDFFGKVAVCTWASHSPCRVIANELFDPEDDVSVSAREEVNEVGVVVKKPTMVVFEDLESLGRRKGNKPDVCSPQGKCASMFEDASRRKMTVIATANSILNVQHNIVINADFIFVINGSTSLLCGAVNMIRQKFFRHRTDEGGVFEDDDDEGEVFEDDDDEGEVFEDDDDEGEVFEDDDDEGDVFEADAEEEFRNHLSMCDANGWIAVGRREPRPVCLNRPRFASVDAHGGDDDAKFWYYVPAATEMFVPDTLWHAC